MIESRFWKEELARIARSVRPVAKQPRWSERAHCVIERDLMIGFFILRRLIELHKVSRATKDRVLDVFAYKARDGSNITRLNGHDLYEMYDLNHEVSVQKKLGYIANQFIHAVTSYVSRNEARTWSDALIVSDFDRKNCIWRIPMAEIRHAFIAASKDYPREVHFVFNPKVADYDVQTD